MQDFVCTLQEWGLCFPQSSGSLAIKSHWPSKSDPLGIPCPFLNPQAEKPDGGLDTLQQEENFFDITILQFVGCPLSGYGI